MLQAPFLEGNAVERTPHLGDVLCLLPPISPAARPQADRKDAPSSPATGGSNPTQADKKNVPSSPATAGSNPNANPNQDKTMNKERNYSA